MIIRSYLEGDEKRVAEIYRYYVENTTVSFEEVAPTECEFAERIKRITSNYPFLVAEDNGKVIGYAYLDVFNPRSAYRKTADLSIYVDVNCRHGGTGKILYTAIEDEAKKRGLKNLISIITEGNEASVKFHEARGFVFVGKLVNVGEKFGKTLSVSYYQKPL